jgi:O-antigen ligase
LVALQNYSSASFSFKLPGLEPSSRLLVWSDAFKTFTEDPITGKGIGQPVSGIIYQNTEGSTSLLTDAHNIFLSVGAQSGLIGLAAILALVLYMLRVSFGAGMNKERSLILNGLGLAFLSAFVYQGLTGSFEDARHLWVLIGMIPAARSICEGFLMEPEAPT